MQRQPALTPQQEAIQEVRTRYERGILTIEQFEYALNALIQAQTPEQCRAIVQELPSSTPSTALDVLGQPAMLAAPRLPGRSWLINIIGELKRMRRPWKLGRHTTAVMGIGALKLDLRQATIPPHGVLEVYTLIGEAKIYVPRNVHVTVRQFTLIGEAKALGEHRAGIFALLGEEEFPAQEPSAAPTPHLEIRMMTLIGSAQVIQLGRSAPAIALSWDGMSLSSGDLQGADLRGMNLEGADLSGRNLEGARLTGANLSGADLHGANLRKASLLGANLEGANLTGADLSEANLRGANLGGAALSGAKLEQARLIGANLEGTTLSGIGSLPQPS